MRLIDADALKEEVKGMFCPDGFKLDFIRAIDNAPAVETLKDITEVHCNITKEQLLNKLRPQGEWIPVYPLTDKCSICNGEALDFNDYPYRSKFCPHCGAKMKGGEAVAEDDLHNPGS